MPRDYRSKKEEEKNGERVGGDNVRWCEEMRKFMRVFIGRNDNLVCIYHKCGKKKRVKVVKNV